MGSEASRPDISIIVPTLNEGEDVERALSALVSLREDGAEIVLADGGSADRTVELARPLCDRLVVAPRGRATQMNAGAAAASGDILLFLHLDTSLPIDALARIRSRLRPTGRVWGRFDVRILGAHPLLPVVAALMNFRSRVTGIATGDQAIFVTHETFWRVGGFPEIALMEDIALSRRLKRETPPLCLAAKASTSGRRWDRNGFWRTIFLMWRLRLSYFLGADPADLARAYGYSHEQ